MRARTIVGVGLCVVDELLLLDPHAPDAPRVRYRERVVSAGGMVATALVQAARLGCRAEIVSVVGEDDEGRFVARELRARGVGTRRLLRSARCPTSVACVHVDGGTGERRFIVPDRRALERRAPEFDVSCIGSRTLLLVDGHYPAQAMRAVRRARQVGAVVIGDFSDSRPAYHRLLPFVDHPIVPAEFGLTWGTGGARDTLLALREEYGGRPVVTEGRRGALAWVEGRVRRIPAVRVPVVDTTGAGDAFHGAFAAGLCHGLGEHAALRLAAYAAAQCCRVLGGQTALVGLDDLPLALRREISAAA